ncbi:POLA2, partial [Symbiodinium necroappetens]
MVWPPRPPKRAAYRGSGAANAGPGILLAGATSRLSSSRSWSSWASRQGRRYSRRPAQTSPRRASEKSSAPYSVVPAAAWVGCPSTARASRLFAPPPAAVMSSTHAAQALVDFDTLAAETGAGDVVLGYLRARGLARTATLALVEPDETRFKATVIDPLIAGFRDDATNTEFRVAPGDQPSARAVLLHMFLEARSQWDAWSAARAAALSPNAGSPAGASTAPAPTLLNLPAWGPLVQAYNAKLLDGKPRQFPTRRLAGADAILARIYHEHTVSKAYTPLMLGEILAARTWTSADELNKLAAVGRDSLAGSLQVVGGAV